MSVRSSAALDLRTVVSGNSPGGGSPLAFFERALAEHRARRATRVAARWIPTTAPGRRTARAMANVLFQGAIAEHRGRVR
jgi:hypothetical protein